MIKEPEVIEVPWVEVEYDPDVVWDSGAPEDVQHPPEGFYKITHESDSFILFTSPQAANVAMARQEIMQERPPKCGTINRAIQLVRPLGFPYIAVVDEEGVEIRCIEV